MDTNRTEVIAIVALCLAGLWFLVGCWLLVRNPDMSSVPAARRRGFWRWLILCAMTVLVANTLILLINSGEVPDQAATPGRAGIFLVSAGISFLTLFIAGPLLFRRLGGVAMVGWIISVIWLFWVVQPQL